MRSRAKITTRNVYKLAVFLPRERGFHKDRETEREVLQMFHYGVDPCLYKLRIGTIRRDPRRDSNDFALC
jgi:hypothetical protein